jgi:hypothetical protein
MPPSHNSRVYDIIGDLIELSTALQDLGMYRNPEHCRSSTLAVCLGFKHQILYTRLTNNLRDGWRLSSAVGIAAHVTNPLTAEETLAAAPFARLLSAADRLQSATFPFDQSDEESDEEIEALRVENIPEAYEELHDALAASVAELACLIAEVIACRVTLPRLLNDDELAALAAEAVAAFPFVADKRIAKPLVARALGYDGET